MPVVLLYAVTIFTGAFLLFEVQPVLAKMILPWFGGSSAVWTVCMLFFQVVLLLGYLYAHWSIEKLRPKTHVILHLSLLAASLLALPIVPSAAWKPAGSEDPVFRILTLLGVTVGLPYFLLCTTGPLIQAWYTRSRQTVAPYRLFAVSNLGSLLALLAYPVIVEPLIAARNQAVLWSAAYCAYAILCGAVAVQSLRRWKGLPLQSDPGSSEAPLKPPPPPAWTTRLLWALLAACSSTLLLAVTNHLCQNVASVPFLWILPLAAYLLSFILCFERDGWYRRTVWMAAMAAALAGMSYSLIQLHWSFKTLLPLFAGGLFVCCMYCHGELAKLKPHPRYLTGYYLIIAAGGALGAVMVGLAAPLVFSGYFELPIALAGCTVLALMMIYRKHWLTDIVWISLAIGVLVMVAMHIRAVRFSTLAMQRNFYGGLRIVERKLPGGEGRARWMNHGYVNHGSQFRDRARRREPTTYYGRTSGAGIAVENWRGERQRVGVVGLGAGTMAVYGRPGDVFRFYEINPQVIQLAQDYFTYLKDCRARVELVLGDGRLSLERESPQAFDVLAIDAFSGDSIPVHLLSREAFELYFRHLRDGGVLAVHISNTNLDLSSVVTNAASALGKAAWKISTNGSDSLQTSTSDWVLVAARDVLDARLAQTSAARLAPDIGMRVWTDDYSNLFGILK